MSENRIHAAHPSFNESLLSASPERAVAAFVECGDLSVDELGRVWRHVIRVGSARKEKTLSPPRRTETMQVTGYTHVKVNILWNRVVCKTHRLVWFLHNGEIPEGCEIHHINEVRHDNRLSNLACLTRSKHQLVHKEDAQTDLLAYSLNRAGLDKSDVAKVLGISPSAVGNKIKHHRNREGLHGENLGSRAREETAYNMYIGGMLLKDVASLTGVCVATVSHQIERYCVRNNLDNPVQSRLSDAKRLGDKTIFDMYVSGMRQVEIAENLHTSIGRISSRLARFCRDNGIDKSTVIRGRRQTNELLAKQS